MNAKEYLEQAYRLDQRINSKLAQKESLKCLATKSTAVIRKDPISSGSNDSFMEDTIIKIVDMEREIDREIDQLVDLKREITWVIDQVDNLNLQVLLELRYLCYKRWPEIAEQMHYTESNVYKLHEKALQKVEENLSRQGRITVALLKAHDNTVG